MKVKIGRRLRDDEMTQSALIAIVESYYAEGMSRGSPLARTHFFEKAITACSDVKGSSGRRSIFTFMFNTNRVTSGNTLRSLTRPHCRQRPMAITRGRGRIGT